MSTEESKPFTYPEVRVVEASAGSGKTYALAKRYVQLLINPRLKPDDIPLRNILAITFTNKATIEMKERILEFLKKIALDAFSSPAEREDILSALGVRPEAARQKAFFVMDHLIRNYNFFQVQTIDSFVNAIVSGCAFTLDLSSRFAIEDDYRSYLAYSLDALIERAHRDGGRRGVFKDFLTQYLHVENRFGWFPRTSILSLVEELYANRNTYGGEFRKLSPATPEDLFAMKNAIIQEARELKGMLPAETNKTFVKSLASFTREGRTAFTLDELSKYFARDEFPVNKGGEVPEELDKKWHDLRRNIQALCRHEAASFYNCYIDIFDLVWRDFRDLARRDDVLFLPELNRQAHELFAQNGVSAPEVYYRLATRFRHFLVDEFQDTSVLQWKNLLPMAEEALSSGGSLFYVGDKKQAIYRFRGGDAALFDRIPAYFENFKPRREVLSQNYRSHAEIVSFNNALFSADNLRSFIEAFQAESADEERMSAGDIAEILAVFADSRQDHQPGKDRGLVRVRHVDAATVEERNALMKDAVKQLIIDLRKRFASKDIAILTRGNDDIELVTGWLLEENIPVESEKTLNIRENGLIKELVSLLTFLNSPIDSLSFASFITGAIFAAAAGVTREEMQDFIFRRNAAARRGGYLYRDFREQYPELWDGFIEEYFVNVGYVPLYELLVSILGKFKTLEKFPEQHAFIERFMELVKIREEDSSGIGPFLAYFAAAPDNDLFVAVSGTDAVRLLTVHKAKGLEFPVVILPFLEMKVNPAGKGGLGMFDMRQDENGITLTRLSRRYAQFSTDLRNRYIERYKQSFIDELNVSYVALTRARCELYAFVPRKAAARQNPVRFLIPADVDAGTEGTYPAAGSAGPETAHMDLPVPAPQDWIGLLKDEFSGDAHLLNRKNIEWGEFIHYALSCIDGPTDAIDAAIGKAHAAYPLVRDTTGAAQALRRLLDDGALRKLLFVEGGTVFREKEIVTRAGQTKRIDRLVVGKDTVRVIDYKTSRIDGDGYREQVRGYMSLAKALYPDKKVSGHILYIDSLKAEEIT